MTRLAPRVLVVITAVCAVSGCTENPSRPKKLTGVAKPAVGSAVLGTGRIRAARPPSAVVLGLLTGKRDGQGRPVRVACQTCHQKIVSANADVYRQADGTFHANIKLRHGRKTCRTCHRLPHFTDFNLADGTPVAHGDVMVLCGQCHSRRLLEYQNGAHGGMTGFWDRKRGVRQRNHCLDCHDPHSPGIPRVRPAPRARNRRLR